MLGWDRDGDALVAPAVARNRDVILQVLQRVLPASGLVLEIASGSGEHAVHFARHCPALRWQPSDPEPAALRSIAAHAGAVHAGAAGLMNLLPPLHLDAAAAKWPVDRAEAILAINLIHIAPWPVTEGLMAGAGRVLPAGRLLVLYGPFTVGGVHTAASNAAFDADLRDRDPRWGLRDVDAVATAGAAQGLRLTERVAMPANNLCLVFRRS